MFGALSQELLACCRDLSRGDSLALVWVRVLGSVIWLNRFFSCMPVARCRPLARYLWTRAVPLMVPLAGCPAVQGRRSRPLSRPPSKGCTLHLLRWGDSMSLCGTNENDPLQQCYWQGCLGQAEGQMSSQHVLLNLPAIGFSDCRWC